MSFFVNSFTRPLSNASALGYVTQGWDNPGAIMTTVQAIAFGAMLAWTPALIIMAFLLWNVPDLDEKE
ncbi:hypothetical protein [Bradyrhizobium sp. OAE829]|uniref:hypothetical protein n=1 Tax=Bradyrhizobium sp. OAE829 TaxID=2663807 RepID=UPI00178906CE